MDSIFCNCLWRDEIPSYKPDTGSSLSGVKLISTLLCVVLTVCKDNAENLIEKTKLGLEE